MRRGALFGIMSKRPDFSKYVAHFTKDGKPCSNDADCSVAAQSAKDRLLSILKSKTLLASKMPWIDTKGVCLTESPWSSLIAHTKQYSPYGIGFKKQLVYNQKGGPVYYIRSDIYSYLRKKKNGIPSRILPFISPFSPSYRNKYQKDVFKKDVDYTFEREWRVPKVFSFDYTDIEFLIVDTFQDVQEINSILNNAISIDKYIVLENYTRIESIWPVHIL